MHSDRCEPREGGIKIVFDVPEQDADRVTLQVRSAGFDVRPYDLRDEHHVGGARQGFVRLGAERALSEFTAAERHRIVAAFDALQREIGFACERVGLDSWTAEGPDRVT